jgi:ABC-type transport system involved in cytochrome c biogenesis permease subunit
MRALRNKNTIFLSLTQSALNLQAARPLKAASLSTKIGGGCITSMVMITASLALNGTATIVPILNLAQEIVLLMVFLPKIGEIHTESNRSMEALR